MDNGGICEAAAHVYMRIRIIHDYISVKLLLLGIIIQFSSPHLRTNLKYVEVVKHTQLSMEHEGVQTSSGWVLFFSFRGIYQSWPAYGDY